MSARDLMDRLHEWEKRRKRPARQDALQNQAARTQADLYVGPNQRGWWYDGQGGGGGRGFL